jgi:S-adenosyl methyltransferase
MTEAEKVPPGVDATTPSPARLYDYFLGGTNNLAVDREAAERFRAVVPEIVDATLANRGFHGRAALWLAHQGIRQFIDIGSGLPTQNNTHEAVRRVAADARVVYVDNERPSGSICAPSPRWSGSSPDWSSCRLIRAPIR